MSFADQIDQARADGVASATMPMFIMAYAEAARQNRYEVIPERYRKDFWAYQNNDYSSAPGIDYKSEIQQAIRDHYLRTGEKLSPPAEFVQQAHARLTPATNDSNDMPGWIKFMFFFMAVFLAGLWVYAGFRTK